MNLRNSSTQRWSGYVMSLATVALYAGLCLLLIANTSQQRFPVSPKGDGHEH